jgi:hypothetical protein
MVIHPSPLQGTGLLFDRQGESLMGKLTIADKVQKRFGQLCNCDECRTPTSSLVQEIVKFIAFMDESEE